MLSHEVNIYSDTRYIDKRGNQYLVWLVFDTLDKKKRTVNSSKCWLENRESGSEKEFSIAGLHSLIQQGHLTLKLRTTEEF